MALHLTPDILRASYEMLRTTPPFKRWKLPHGDEIEFHVTMHEDLEGDYLRIEGGVHRIRLSAKWHSRLSHVVYTVAHEMVHLRQRKLNKREKMHGPLFKRLAAQVCRHHDFDAIRF